MNNLIHKNEKILLEFQKIKKAVRLEFAQLFFSVVFLFAALFSNLFDKSFTSAFIIGSIFLFTYSLSQRTTYKLIAIIDNIISSNPEYLKEFSELKKMD